MVKLNYQPGQMYYDGKSVVSEVCCPNNEATEKWQIITEEEANIIIENQIQELEQQLAEYQKIELKRQECE